MSLWVVVPTRGDHPDLLRRAVGTCGVPAERVVVVRTADCDVPDGVTVVDDRGDLNIHRWWNAGIGVAEAGGASHVAVLNDDIRLMPSSLMLMAGALVVADADLCWARPGAVTGWAWVLRLASPVRPDERFAWWWGDTDLQWQAGDRWVSVDARIWHVAGNAATNGSEVLRSIADVDRVTFETKWGVTCSQPSSPVSA